MTPTQHTMLNRLVEKLASVPIRSHKFVGWLHYRREKNSHIQLSLDEQRRLIALHNELLEQGLVPQLEVA